MAEGAPILVVDDHPNTLSEVSRSLNSAGFQVETVSDGSEAFERCRSAEYSLIITDRNTPQIDGLDLLNSLKKISPRIPVIIMTAKGSVNNAVEAMQAGAADYLLKPFSPESLEKTVTRALGGSNGNGRSRLSAKKSGSVAHGKEIVTRNRAMLDILKQARGVAPSSATVLIRGESGTGKELLAAYVHQHSLHADAPYVALNCAALPDTLAESELFGHEKGSFTGAVGRKIGKFELAQKGTVVLDEISEMPLPLQAKLLRVLQEREVDRIGGTRPVPIDARVVAISNVDLKKAVADRKFREDLYYRINVIPLILPPLRERRDDIELLAHRFIEKFNLANHKEVIDIDKAALDMLTDYDWRGNVRELENVIERAVLIADGPRVKTEHLLLESSAGNLHTAENLEVKAGFTVRQMEKKLIYKTLKEVDDNRTQAAELLGISIRTLRNKLHEYKAETAGPG
ncbi:MAG: sigma-54 dependent transcriptional regulator [Deltaproteobacteria bacterium]|nr:sigma-54 dependent transcriptional regulator [Deltaproteobacteria bacterium]